MPNQKYWSDRAEERAQRLYDKADNSYVDLQKLFSQASKDMTDATSAFYNKYGKVILSPKFDDKGIAIPNGDTAKLVVTYNEALKYKRLDSLVKQLNVILSTLSKEQNKYMQTELKTLAQEAYNSFYFDMFQGYGVGYQFDLLDPKLVNELIKNPVNGQNFSERVWNNRDLLANQVNQELKNGLIQGISTKDMSKRLSSKMGSGYKVAERLMRTEITNTYNQATLQGYKASGIVKKYEYLATLDNRTSEICQLLDGKVFDIDKASVGINYPPMHVNCRSTTVSKFDDEVFTRRARDSKTGKTYTVPSNMNYTEWDSVYNKKTMSLEDLEKKKQQNPIEINEKISEVLKNYTRGQYTDYVEYSQYLADNLKMKTDKDFYESNVLPNITTETKKDTEELLSIIKSQNITGSDLFRIEKYNKNSEYIKGDIIDWGIHSTSRDSEFIENVLKGTDKGLELKNDGEVVIYKIVGDKKQLDISKFSPYDQKESLVAGRFEVIDTDIIKYEPPKIQAFSDTAKLYPDNFEYFTSKKGNSMIRDLTNNQMFSVEASAQKKYIGEKLVTPDIEYQLSQERKNAINKTIITIKEVIE